MTIAHAKAPAEQVAVGDDPALEYRVPRDDGEASAMMDIISQSLHFPRPLADRYVKIVGAENFRLVAAQGKPAGGAAILPMGQFFGGRRVEMAGIAAVGVAPEHRARGVATRLMQEVVRELHGQGCALSTLYPATSKLYRRTGYEFAGVRDEMRVSIRLINVRDASMRVRAIAADDEPALEALYRAEAARRPGHLDRHHFLWTRAREPRGEKTHGYVVVNPATGRIEGWVRFVQKDAEKARFSLHVSDSLITTPEAGRAILTLFAQHRSMAEEVILYGSPAQPLLNLLPELTFFATRFEQWMTRIIDIGAALAQRGYPRGLDAELHLELRDDLITANDGRWLLRVREGAGTIERGGRGDVKIDIRGLASLYTGHTMPHELRLQGQIEPPRDERGAAALETAQTIFAGPAPWMADMF